MEDSVVSFSVNETVRSVIFDLNFLGYEDGQWWLSSESKPFFKGLGKFFYLINRGETTFEKIGEVPNYFAEAWPYFLLFIFMENILLWIQDKPIMRFNDGITSLSHGLAHECAKIIFRALESYSYVYIYTHFRILDLSWNKALTWYIAALAMDFFYYWGHRAGHEIHILWAQHQVHHSSEDFNTAVGLRQSVFQGFSFLFYLPMALAIPPSLFITHQHFNLLYQFWIHTETVKTLGPLEYIFNTPQHHRVHHGSNIWCLDKNYGGVLIIWDRIFGTFGNDQDEEIIYGLVVNKPSFNPLQLQTFYTIYVMQKFFDMKTWKLKICALFYGPSWQPGRPRLGLDEDKIKVQPRQKYDATIPFWCNLYILTHFCCIVYGYYKIMDTYLESSPVSVISSIIYIFVSLTSMGMLLDSHPYACLLEVLRCMALVTLIQKTEITTVHENILTFIEVFFLLSGLFWFFRSMNTIKTIHKVELKEQ